MRVVFFAFTGSLFRILGDFGVSHLIEMPLETGGGIRLLAFLRFVLRLELLLRLGVLVAHGRGWLKVHRLMGTASVGGKSPAGIG